MDDGSADATAALVDAYGWGAARASGPNSNPGNRGKGYAIRNGMLESPGEYSVTSDAGSLRTHRRISRCWPPQRARGP